jgi:hypothetical protein
MRTVVNAYKTCIGKTLENNHSEKQKEMDLKEIGCGMEKWRSSLRIVSSGEGLY